VCTVVGPHWSKTENWSCHNTPGTKWAVTLVVVAVLKARAVRPATALAVAPDTPVSTLSVKPTSLTLRVAAALHTVANEAG